MSEARDDKPLRLVAYNILYGGKGRIDPIHETLKYLGGHVMGLCEAHDAEGVAQLARKLRCEHAVAEGGQEGNKVALLSRLPIERIVNLAVRLPELNRPAMEAVVLTDDPGVPRLRVIVLHLTHGLAPERERQRMEELEQLLAVAGQEPDLPTVMMGDLNASAPYHPFDPERLGPKRRERARQRGDTLDYDVVNRLAAEGWIDSYHRFHPDDPADTFTTGFPALRVDYIWTDRQLGGKLVDAEVERGGFTPYCSDHFPVWASLDVRP